MANQKLNIDIVAKDKSKQAFNRLQGTLSKVKASVFNLKNAFVTRLELVREDRIAFQVQPLNHSGTQTMPTGPFAAALGYWQVYQVYEHNGETHKTGAAPCVEIIKATSKYIKYKRKNCRRSNRHKGV